MRDWLPVYWESSEPLKAFQECQHRLPAHSLLNAHFSRLLRTGCARQPSYKDRECSEAMKGRHSLSDVNGEI